VNLLVVLLHKFKNNYLAQSIGALCLLFVIGCKPRIKRFRVDTATVVSSTSAAPQETIVDSDIDHSLDVVSTASYVQQQEARLSDVSIPLGSQPRLDDIPIHDTAEHSFLLYDVADTPERIAQFYKLDMERLGWQLQYDRMLDPQLLIFEKPHQICTILLKNHESISDITVLSLFYGKKLE
jgi:hypothetical protein